MLPVRTVVGALAFAAMAMAGPLASTQAQSSADGHSRTEASASEDGAPKALEDGAQKSRLVSILGLEVTNRDGDAGRVIDVLVDLDGRSGAVVVEFGGFMGIGSRKVAVEWSALRFVREGNRSLLVINVSREQIKVSPEYRPNEPPAAVLGTLGTK